MAMSHTVVSQHLLNTLVFRGDTHTKGPKNSPSVQKFENFEYLHYFSLTGKKKSKLGGGGTVFINWFTVSVCHSIRYDNSVQYFAEELWRTGNFSEKKIAIIYFGF